MTELAPASPWAGRWTKMVTVCGIGAALIALIGSYGSGFGFWPFTVGFLFIGVAIVLALLTLIASPLALWKAGRAAFGNRGFLLGLVCALGFVGVMGYWINRGSNAPMIHDVTTDLANPPAFQKLSVRADNLVGVGTIEKWRELHAGSYADLRPVTLTATPAQAITKIEALVRARGWDVALVAPDRVEATDTASPFKFKDDVVITVTPVEGGQQSIVNMRSVSRVGMGDLGVNAARIQAFMADLAK